jgi:hypothetical protein
MLSNSLLSTPNPEVRKNRAMPSEMKGPSAL